MSSAVNLSKMLFDNTNFRTINIRSAPAPAPTPTQRRNVNPAFHLSKFISNATNTGPCRACGH